MLEVVKMKRIFLLMSAGLLLLGGTLLFCTGCSSEEAGNLNDAVKSIHNNLGKGETEEVFASLADPLKSQIGSADSAAMKELVKRCSPYINPFGAIEKQEEVQYRGKTYQYIAARNRMGIVMEIVSGKDGKWFAAAILTPSETDRVMNCIYHEVRCTSEKIELPEDVLEELDSGAIWGDDDEDADAGDE